MCLGAVSVPLYVAVIGPDGRISPLTLPVTLLVVAESVGMLAKQGEGVAHLRLRILLGPPVAVSRLLPGYATAHLGELDDYVHPDAAPNLRRFHGRRGATARRLS